MRRPRILVVGLNYTPETTGIAPYTAGIARGLADDFDVDVLTTHPHYPQWQVHDGHGGWRRSTDEGGVSVHRLRHYVPANPTGKSRILSELTFAARILTARVRRPDLVLAVSPSLLSTEAAIRLAHRWNVPVGVQVQDIYSLAAESMDSMSGGLTGRIRQLESRILGSATGVATIHARMAAAISALSGLRLDDVTVIRNWTHVARPEGDRSATRHQLGWREHETVVLHAGNMGAKQALDNLVDAGRLAEREGRPVRFVLMGDGSDRARLATLADGARQVEFVQPVGDADFTNVLAAADVLCLNEKPGLKEMCAPSKLTSYFATGVPVVAATESESAAAHDVRASGAGLVVAPGDPEALLDGVTTLATAEGRALGEHGPTFADTHLSRAAAMTAYRSWVEALLAAKRVPTT